MIDTHTPAIYIQSEIEAIMTVHDFLYKLPFSFDQGFI